MIISPNAAVPPHGGRDLGQTKLGLQVLLEKTYPPQPALKGVM